jgi:hypothetical protein
VREAPRRSPLWLPLEIFPAPGSVVEHTAPIIQRRVKAMATAPTIFTFRVDTLFYFLRHGLRSSSAFKKKAPAPSAGAFFFYRLYYSKPPRKGWRAVAA